ncbi:MAG: 30S ribosomal protein S20 [Planctomycetota bacterium]|jgi:small subunit ribosomal protein S20
MAHSNSAEKRIRQNEKARIRNRGVKSAIRSQLKKTDDAIASGDTAAAKAEFKVATKRLDKAAKNRVIHPNEADRRKSRIAKRIAKLG